MHGGGRRRRGDRFGPHLHRDVARHPAARRASGARSMPIPDTMLIDPSLVARAVAGKPRRLWLCRSTASPSTSKTARSARRPARADRRGRRPSSWRDAGRPRSRQPGRHRKLQLLIRARTRRFGDGGAVAGATVRSRRQRPALGQLWLDRQIPSRRHRFEFAPRRAPGGFPDGQARGHWRMDQTPPRHRKPVHTASRLPEGLKLPTVASGAEPAWHLYVVPARSA